MNYRPPGRANKTTLFPLNRSAELTSFQVKGFDPPIDSSLTLALKTTFGTSLPSLIMERDLVLILPSTGLKAFDESVERSMTAMRAGINIWA